MWSRRCWEYGTTHSFLVLAQSGVDDTHVEENLACIANLVELSKSFVKLIIVVATKGRDPGLNFLHKPRVSAYATPSSDKTTRPTSLTCFRDIVPDYARKHRKTVE
ncbi:hypothetical protein MKX07_007612 [Trichoderma sp. CBMAI-0711]|nr:hypothetical protein MKX07_007612 [Trichoderma sp. CBMAI-0711]